MSVISGPFCGPTTTVLSGLHPPTESTPTPSSMDKDCDEVKKKVHESYVHYGFFDVIGPTIEKAWTSRAGS